MITVESLEPGYYGLVATWLSNPQINRWLASTWRGKHITEKHVSVVCMNPRNKLFLVRYDDEPCGLVALGCIDPVDKTGNLWYLMGQDLGGRGIMTTAVRQVATLAFDELGLTSLTASVMASNKASSRVLEKNGFRLVGVRRKAFVLDGEHVNRIVFDLLPEDLA